MLFKKALLPMMIVASLTGCGPAALDGSTPDTLEESVAKVASKLPEAQRVQFGADLTLIKSYYEKQSPDQLLINLNGKSAADITAEASNLREEQRLQQEKLAIEEQQRAYLSELKEKKASLEEAIKPLQDSQKQSLELAEFVIESGKLGQMKHKDTGDVVNGIELVLKNGTAEEIYAAMFNGMLSAKGEGEGKPILASGFDIAFETPLQPGETRTVLFIPPMVSDWRSVAIPADADFTIQLDELLNIANKPLFSKAEFSLEDQASLDKLLADLKAVNSELGVAAGGDTVVPQAPAQTASEPASGAHETSDSTALLPEQSEDAALGAAETGVPAVPVTEDSPVSPDVDPNAASAPADDLEPITAAGGESASASDTTAAPAPAVQATDDNTHEGEVDAKPQSGTATEAEAASKAPVADLPQPDSSLPSVGQPETPVTPLKSS